MRLVHRAWPAAIAMLTFVCATIRAEPLLRQTHSTVVEDSKNAIESVVYSPDGKLIYLATGGPFSKGHIFVLETDTLNQTAKFPASLLSRLAVNKTGDLLAGVDYLGLLTLYSPTTGRVIHQFDQIHERGVEITGVAFSPNGKTLVTGGGDNQLVFWDVASRKCTHNLEVVKHHQDAIHDKMAITSTSDIVFTFAGRSLIRVELATGKILDRAVPRNDGYYWVGLALSPDDKTLVLAFQDNEAEDKPQKPTYRNPLVLVDAKTLKVRKTLGTHPYGGARHLKFIMDGKYLVSAGREDGHICIWDMTTEKLVSCQRVINRIKGSRNYYEIDAMDVSPDGKKLVVISEFQRTVNLWDISEVTAPKGK
jgi:WD40 repeat protein